MNFEVLNTNFFLNALELRGAYGPQNIPNTNFIIIEIVFGIVWGPQIIQKKIFFYL